jgi:hypothetical protein
MREDQGLYKKFEVFRCDESDRPGAKHAGCNYFVLDLTCDPFAGPAITAYAHACAVKYPKLADELLVKAAAMYARHGIPPADAPLPEGMLQTLVCYTAMHNCARKRKDKKTCKTIKDGNICGPCAAKAVRAAKGW